MPTISDQGRNLSVPQAVEVYRQTGKHFGKFDTVSNATAYARELNVRQESQDSRKVRTPSEPEQFRRSQALSVAARRDEEPGSERRIPTNAVRELGTIFDAVSKQMGVSVSVPRQAVIVGSARANGARETGGGSELPQLQAKAVADLITASKGTREYFRAVSAIAAEFERYLHEG